jgi:peptidoglycan/xylan/chitin deacetylase (PgdA/CDA1 family)
MRYRSVSIGEVIAWATAGEKIPERSVLITFDDGYADLAVSAFPTLRAAGFSAAVFVVTACIGGWNSWEDPVGMGGQRLLDEQSIKEWSARGIEFGAHSRSHTDLTKLDSGQLVDELGGSRVDLEGIVGREVQAFAYPYGGWDARSRRAAASAFSLAFTTQEGVNRPGDDPHLLRRTMVQGNDSEIDIALRAWLGRSPRPRIRVLLGSARRRFMRARSPARSAG